MHTSILTPAASIIILPPYTHCCCLHINPLPPSFTQYYCLYNKQFPLHPYYLLNNTFLLPLCSCLLPYTHYSCLFNNPHRLTHNASIFTSTAPIIITSYSLLHAYCPVLPAPAFLIILYLPLSTYSCCLYIHTCFLSNNDALLISVLTPNAPYSLILRPTALY